MSEEKEHKSGKGETKIGAVIILIISAIVFIPAGGAAVFQAFFNKNDVPTFGSYNGKKIEYVQGSEFATTASNIAQSYQAQGYDVNQMQYSILMNAFNQTVLNMAITDAVESSGWTVPQNAVNRTMLQYFTDENGNFSQKLYNQADDSTVKEIRSDIEKSLAYSRYTDDLFGRSDAFNGTTLYGTKSSSKENDFIASMGAEKHAYAVAAFDTSNFPESEAVKYGKENADTFSKYNLSAITVTDKDAASSLLKQIKANEITFEDALSEKSSNAHTDSDGKVTSNYKYQIEKLFSDPSTISSIDSLSTGDISDVLETTQGYTIFRNDGAKTIANFDDEEMINTVISYLNTYESSYIEDYYINIANNFRTNAAINGFENACTKFEVTSNDIPPFPVNYNNSSFIDRVPTDITEIASLNSNESALSSIFNLKIDELSQPLVIDSNVVVVKCTDIINDGPAATDSYSSSIAYIDQSSAQQAILSGDKVENNFMQAYFKYFLGNY